MHDVTVGPERDARTARMSMEVKEMGTRKEEGK